MMKKITLLMFVSLLFGMSFAQTSFFMDYDGYDELQGQSLGYNYQRFVWPLNTSADAGFGNMQWVVVDYDQLIVSEDGATFTTLPSSGSLNVTLDSVLVIYNYSPEKDTLNDITFSVYDFDDVNRGNFGVSEVVDPVVGATPLYTESLDEDDLTISTNLEELTLYPNLALAPGQNFSIYMQNVSDTLDVFNLWAGYNENCADAELGLNSEAAFNSSCYMNYDANGPISPQQYNWGPAEYNCRSFYTQNWVIVAYVTIEADSLLGEIESSQLTTETCPGSVTTLSANAFGGSGNYTYEWSPAMGLSSTSAQDVIVTIGEDNVDYFLTITDVDSGDVVKDTVTVFSFDVAVVASGPSDLTLSCDETSNVTATATTEGFGFAISSITWTGPNSNPLMVSESGQYIVTATNSVGCTASDTVNISVSGENDIDFVVPDPICTESGVQFTNSSSSIDGWDFTWIVVQAGDTLTESGAAVLNRQFTEAGSYQIYLVGDSASCEFSSFESITVTSATVAPCLVSISDLSFETLAVYPNPAKGYLNVDFTLNSSNDVDLAIYGVDGKSLDSRSFSNEKNVNTTFNTSNLNSGIYFLKITTNEGSSTQKFVVNNN